MKGWCIIPNTGVPLCNSAISVPQIGKPAMKDLVPSIGSVLGEMGLDQPPHHRFRGAVGLGHRIEIVAVAFVVDGKRGSEERQDGFPRGSREVADEGCKIDNRHGDSLKGAGRECVCSCLAQSRMQRTVRAGFIQHRDDRLRLSNQLAQR
jgi:hypothetical protein